jgi:hypothetical protein
MHADVAHLCHVGARLAYWRAPTYNLTRLLLTLAICLFYGTMVLGRGRLPSGGARPPHPPCSLRETCMAPLWHAVHVIMHADTQACTSATSRT